MRLLFRTRPYCLDGPSVGELPATRDSGVVSLYHPTLSPTLSEGESEQKETSRGSGLATLALTITDVTVHTIFLEMYDSWIV